MKIKRFKNLWTMGLIVFGGILITLYTIKLFFPKFFVGVAELSSIVALGTYVDTHFWAYYLFNFIISMITYFFYCCACCRKSNLNYIEWIIIAVCNIALFVIQEVLPQYYVYFNIMSLTGIPCIMCLISKNVSIKYMYSSCVVFCIHNIAQMLTLEIRDISTLISLPNSATFTILVIDSLIWLVLLYNYYNFKEKD